MGGYVMNDLIAEKEINTYKIKIFIDNNPENPRTEWDNLGHMVCFHKSYTLGDKENNYSSSDYSSWEDMEKDIIKQEKVVVILPLYLYDHSGITISTTPFSCPWDSGQVGFIYVTRKDILKEFSCKKITKDLKNRAVKILESEVECYDMYLRGDVYGYIIEDEQGNNIESCWGFYDTPENIIAECEKNINKNYDYQLSLYKGEI